MTTAVAPKTVKTPLVLPKHRGAFYGGQWHEPKNGRHVDNINPGTGELARQSRRQFRRGCRCRGEGGQEGVRGMAQHAAAGARAAAQAHRQCAARARRGTGDDRRRRLRQPLSRDGQGRDGRRRADRVLRRPRHRDERLIDPDGPGRGQFLRARAARRGRAHHSVQSSVHVLRGKGRRRRSRPATPW